MAEEVEESGNGEGQAEDGLAGCVICQHTLQGSADLDVETLMCGHTFLSQNVWWPIAQQSS